MARQWIARSIMSSVLVVSLTLGSAGLASADTNPPEVPALAASNISVALALDMLVPDDPTQITKEEIDALHEGIWEVLEAQHDQGEVTFTTDANGNHLYQTNVTLAGGQIVQFIHETSPTSAQAQALPRAEQNLYQLRSSGNEWYPKIWSGSDSKGRWVRFNRAAQSLMIGAGGTALKAAICAIPGVNAVGCAIVWGATLVAKQVIKKIGRCPASRPWLYAYPSNLGASGCRK